MVSKYLGIGVCVIGSILAILFVPTKILGTSTGWHFIGGEVSIDGGLIIVPAHEILDISTLILELIFINGIGIAIYYLGRKR
jgi:hypothetical protein